MPKKAPPKKAIKPARAVERAEWSIADAKARLSELVEKTSDGAQTITRNGKPVAVVVALEEWRRKTGRKGTLMEFFQTAPAGAAELDLERWAEEPRDLKL